MGSMATNLTNALMITLIGMSLVFGAIVLLWGVMALLMRLTSSKEEDIGSKIIEKEDINLKRQAAAIAVAVALAQSAKAEPPKVFPLPPTAVVSPWQSVMRSKILNKRGQVR